jgi:amicoumacin kinase
VEYVEPWIRDRYHEGILHAALRRYGVSDGYKELDGFENYIYEFTRPDGEFILRIGHAQRRSENLVRGEVDWINYLSDGGVSVARAVPSLSGSLVEPVADGQGGHFLAAAFVKAYGEQPWFVRTPEFYRSYGRLLGSMHALTAQYQPPDPAWRRFEWDDPLMQAAVWKLPDSEASVKQRYRELLEHLNTLPKDPTCFGLIHQDVHAANFLMDAAGTLTLYDFDDCAYSWYANDIAIALFYMILEAPEGPAFANQFMPHFLQGYREVYAIENRWLREIPAFLKEREIELYGVIYDAFGPNPVEDEWCLNYMRSRREKIEGGVPFGEVVSESVGSWE